MHYSALAGLEWTAVVTSEIWQALRRIAEDQELRGQLPAEVLTRLEDSLANSGGNLQALLLSPGVPLTQTPLLVPHSRTPL